MREIPGGVYPLLRAISIELARRRPLIADSRGWVDVEKLCAAVRTRSPQYSNIGPAELAELHSELKTARDRFDLLGERIRARYPKNFHGIPPQPPTDDVPAVLFHSAAKCDPPHALKFGLQCARGSTLPLATSVDDAQERSRRMRDEETVFIVHSEAARELGVRFWVVDDDQYLAEHLPNTALSLWVEERIDPPLVSIQESRVIAEAELSRTASEWESRLVGPIDRPRHWVWGYHEVHGEPMAGQPAIAVSKVDGRIRRLLSGRSIEAQI